MNVTFPLYFKHAISEASKSNLRVKVGACLVVGKSILKGHNKDKTHPEFANPQRHIRKSLHAELDCLIGMREAEGGEIYVYREVAGKPALARPCEHCLKFLSDKKISILYYSIPEYPFWKKETI